MTTLRAGDASDSPYAVGDGDRTERAVEGERVLKGGRGSEVQAKRYSPPDQGKGIASPRRGSPETVSSIAVVRVVKRRSKSGMRQVATIAGSLLLREAGRFKWQRRRKSDEMVDRECVVEEMRE